MTVPLPVWRRVAAVAAVTVAPLVAAVQAAALRSHVTVPALAPRDDGGD